MKKIYYFLILLIFGFIILLLINSFPYKKEKIRIGFELQEIASGLNAPVRIVSDPLKSNKLYVLEQRGIIKTIDENREVEIFLNISDKIVSDFSKTIFEEFDERGLLGLAFHPNYEENKKFYLYYSVDSDDLNFDHKNIIAEYNSEDLNYEKIILEIEHPQFNHNGGEMIFGSDGYLYIGVGDGGGANDNFFGHSGGFGYWETAPANSNNLGNAQDLSKLHGKILRIDVDKKSENKNAGEYSIPIDNPFIDTENKEEIYIYGLRNPWAFSFDRVGNMYIGDVGQDYYEEIDFIRFNKTRNAINPVNLGWRKYEGNHIFSNSSLTEDLPLVFPIAEYAHPTTLNTEVIKIGISIIGGFVYEGELNPLLKGKYIFADWSSEFGKGNGKLFFLSDSNEIIGINIKNLENKFINSLGKDNSEELYIAVTSTGFPSERKGFIYRLKQINS